MPIMLTNIPQMIPYMILTLSFLLLGRLAFGFKSLTTGNKISYLSVGVLLIGLYFILQAGPSDHYSIEMLKYRLENLNCVESK